MLLRKEKGIIGYIDIKKSVGTLFLNFSCCDIIGSALAFRRYRNLILVMSSVLFADTATSFRRYANGLPLKSQG